MKKCLALLLAMMMLLCLCACGGQEEAPAPAAAEATDSDLTEETAAEATDSDLAAEQPADDSAGNVVVAPGAAAAEEAASVDQEMFNLALECIGLSPADLYAAIGEPDGTEYTSSCLEDDAEDGMLYYNDYGFYVWTLRYTDGTETIQDVLEM